MSDNKQEQTATTKPQETAAKNPASAGAPKKSFKGGANTNKRRPQKRETGMESEYDQQILDLARVTRVMAGGKRMRFRACIVLGNRNGKVGIGLAKGADVTLAITKAVNQAKKNMIDVPLTADSSIPHEIKHKFGASLILLRPAAHGRGIICGGVMRIIAELAGIKNITGKILGTNNNVTNSKCMIEALASLKPAKAKKKEVKAETEVKKVEESEVK